MNAIEKWAMRVLLIGLLAGVSGVGLAKGLQKKWICRFNLPGER